MYAASEKMDFEKAASYRDLLNSVKQIDQKQKITSSEMDDKDVIAFARDKDEAVVQVFFVRHGRLIGREHFYVSGVANDTESQVLTAFVKQYYASSPFVPSTLMLQYPLDVYKRQDFIKTSTGFGSGGATFEDVALFAAHVGENVRIKAAGGIGSFEDAKHFLELGASRLGTSLSLIHI